MGVKAPVGWEKGIYQGTSVEGMGLGLGHPGLGSDTEDYLDHVERTSYFSLLQLC